MHPLTEFNRCTKQLAWCLFHSSSSKHTITMIIGAYPEGGEPERAYLSLQLCMEPYPLPSTADPVIPGTQPGSAW